MTIMSQKVSLVVFVRTTKRFAPELEQSDGLRFINVGGKIIYYMEVQISNEGSARCLVPE
jgi:hypothetical protein